LTSFNLNADGPGGKLKRATLALKLRTGAGTFFYYNNWDLNTFGTIGERGRMGLFWSFSWLWIE